MRFHCHVHKSPLQICPEPDEYTPQRHIMFLEYHSLIAILAKHSPKVVFELLTRLLRIREVLGSNLNPESDVTVSLLFSGPPWKLLDGKLGNDHFLPHRFQFIVHLLSFAVI
jgi:hypothetical protein